MSFSNSGSIGTSAERLRNKLCTYYEALIFLDKRFQQFRFKAVQRMEGEPCAQAVAMRVINLRWAKARQELKKSLLKQKEREHDYRPIRTVNTKCAGKDKVKPRNSVTQRRKQGRLRKQRSGSGRSHHKGVYYPINLPVRRGRPATVSKMSPERQKEHRRLLRKRKAAERRAETDARRRESGWREYPYPRRTSAEVAEHRSQMKKYSWAIWGARVIVGGLRRKWKDQRANHDKRYKYAPPAFRFRATHAQVLRNRHCGSIKFGGYKSLRHTAGGRAGKPDPLYFIKHSPVILNLKRAKHMRGYWRKVHDYTQTIWRHHRKPEKYRSPKPDGGFWRRVISGS